jgi:hypothetical protein
VTERASTPAVACSSASPSIVVAMCASYLSHSGDGLDDPTSGSGPHLPKIVYRGGIQGHGHLLTDGLMEVRSVDAVPDFPIDQDPRSETPVEVLVQNAFVVFAILALFGKGLHYF